LAPDPVCAGCQYIGLNGLQAFDKVGHIDHQIALNREVGQRLNLNAFGVFAQEGFTGQLRHFVDHHAAGTADRHAAGPAIAEVRREVVFDITQRVQQRGLLIIRHFIERAVRCGVHFRVVAHHFNFQVFHLSHLPSPSSRLLPLLRHIRVSPAAEW
jgi:hypothetical protein